MAVGYHRQGVVASRLGAGSGTPNHEPLTWRYTRYGIQGKNSQLCVKNIFFYSCKEINSATVGLCTERKDTVL